MNDEDRYDECDQGGENTVILWLPVWGIESRALRLSACHVSLFDESTASTLNSPSNATTDKYDVQSECRLQVIEAGYVVSSAFG